MMQQAGLNLSNTGPKHWYDRKKPQYYKKEVYKNSELDKTKSKSFSWDCPVTDKLQGNTVCFFLFYEFSICKRQFERFLD